MCIKTVKFKGKKSKPGVQILSYKRFLLREKREYKLQGRKQRNVVKFFLLELQLIQGYLDALGEREGVTAEWIYEVQRKRVSNYFEF